MTKMTSEKFAKELWEGCKVFSESLFKDLSNHNNKSIKDNYFKQEVSKTNLSKEIIIINLWLISKSLFSDKKTLDNLHRIYFLEKATLSDDLEEKITLTKIAQKDLQNRYKEYYSLLNGNGNHELLANKMLEYMFSNGHEKQLHNHIFKNTLKKHILSTMKFLIEIRGKIKIVN